MMKTTVNNRWSAFAVLAAICALLAALLPQVAFADSGAATQVKQVSAGAYFSAYVTESGDLYTFGSNYAGLLGTGDEDNRTYPVKVASNVASVSCGDYHIAYVDNNGDLYVCGNNVHGQLGNGTKIKISEFAKVASNVASVYCGYAKTAYIDTEGDLYICGYNYYGQLGLGDEIDRATFVKIASGVASFSCGGSHNAYVTTAGDLYVCGVGTSGQLGTGSKANLTSFTKVAENVASVSCGDVHTAYIDTAGNLWTTGHNTYGQLGTGDYTWLTSFKQVAGASNVASVSCGYCFTTYTSKSGQLFACGENYHGQLGDGVEFASRSTTDGDDGEDDDADDESGETTHKWAVSSFECVATNVKQASSGWYHNIYVSTEGKVYACGNGNSGQLGDGRSVTSEEEYTAPYEDYCHSNFWLVGCKHENVRYDLVATQPATLSTWGTAVSRIYCLDCCAYVGTTSDEEAIPCVGSVKLAKTSYVYTGKMCEPAVTVSDAENTVLKAGTDYTVTYASGCKKPGTYKVEVKGIGNYSFTKVLSFKITKATNPLKFKAAKKTYNAKTLKAKKRTFKIAYAKKAAGKVTYKLTKKAKKAKIKVSRTGKVTVPKKCKKGIYRITVKAAGNACYKAATKTFKVVVK